MPQTFSWRCIPRWPQVGAEALLRVAARRRYAIQSLTIAAAKLDPRRGYPMLIQMLATLDDAEFRQQVSFLLEQMQAAEAKR